MIRNRLSSILAVSLLAACASVEDPKPADTTASPSATPSTSRATPAPVQDRSAGVSQPQGTAGSGTMSRPSSQGAVTGNPLASGQLAQRSVYFDYDSNAVKDEYRGLIEEHARYLRENPSVKARIEGNADERGSREYNLALGQRRAEAVVKTLRLMGIPENRLEAVSYGEEKPRRTGHDEASWAENRRGDLVVGK